MKRRRQQPPTATPFLRFSAADPTDLDFSKFKKEIRRGRSKKCKSQGWRGGSAFGWQTAGLALVSSFPQNRF